MKNHSSIVKVNFKHLLFISVCVLGGMLYSCGPAQEQESDTAVAEVEEGYPLTITVNAEDFSSATGELQVETTSEGGKYIVIPEGENSVEFEITVPTAGRYQLNVHANAASAETTAWVEDYIDNKDDRTYNVTGNISIPASTDNAEFAISGKDGSPLNKGPHKMRLHLKGGGANVAQLTFHLMREHKLTPQTLTQKTDGKEWKVVWSDEFDVDGLPDTTKWTFDIGNWGWGNNELQYYTDKHTENARVENGNLIIEARKNDMDQLWTSARLTTRGKTTFLYGRIEFKAKVPVEKGNWAAGWTLGDEYVDELSWPYCGEIDILETVGYELNDTTGNGKAHASAHCGAYYFKLNNQPTGIVDVENMKEEYHIYAVDWTPEGITAYVDGEPYFTYEDTSSELAWPFNKNQNIILNLAMGGGWGGLQGMNETVTSQKYIIDYVRVYEKQ